MKPIVRRVGIVCGAGLGLVLAANLLYAAKSLAGVNLDPFGDRSHHGAMFPLGDRIYRHFRHAA